MTEDILLKTVLDHVEATAAQARQHMVDIEARIMKQFGQVDAVTASCQANVTPPMTVPVGGRSDPSSPRAIGRTRGHYGGKPFYGHGQTSLPTISPTSRE